jgi:ligand-binding sensor domain-containing protein
MNKALGFFLCLVLLFPVAVCGQSLKDRITVFSPKDAVLEKAHITSLAISPQGTIWGTNKGVFFEKPDGTGIWFTEKDSPFTQQNISACAFHQGDIWFTVRTPVGGQGVFRFNGKRWTHFEHELLTRLISCMHEDSAKNLWIGHDERGLDLFIGGPQESQIVNFKAIKAKHGLHDASVTSMTDSNGLLYVGFTKGLSAFPIAGVKGGHKGEKPVQSWKYPDTFPALSVFSLAPFNGKIAAATELGLVIPEGNGWKLLGPNTGYPGNPCIQLAWDGTRLWTSNQRGIQVYENGQIIPIIESGNTAFASIYPTCMAALPQPNGGAIIAIGTTKGARTIVVK